LMRFSSFFFAHRPFPSMMMATWAGSFAGSSPYVSEKLEFKDFFLFFPVNFVDLFDVVVG
jgi:hypothetical protein